jgi:uncharacterized protein YegJ (DUF2314 family)
MSILFLGCKDSTDLDSVAHTVINVEKDDPEMIAAIETAKRTFSFFEGNWKTMESDGYSLKFAIPTSDGELEHIWFSPTKIDGNKITGECANDPVKVPGLKLGDIRTVTRDDVSDWMIVVGKKCFGGYTIRVLAQRDPQAAPPLEFADPPKD